MQSSDHFAQMDDPIERTKQHKLMDIITIAICGVNWVADTWVDIETYGEAKYSFLKQFLELPLGIPSHDTFARVFARLNPEQFKQCFLNWIKSISNITSGEIIAIDGKTLRHSYDKGGDKGAILKEVHGRATNRLVLGLVLVDEKSNEITAIPKLLKLLSLHGCIVTIDAMGCQKEIVKLIAEHRGDYVITLKKNQGSLYDRVEELFKEAVKSKFQGFNHSDYRIQEQGHGPKEIRYYSMLSNIKESVDPKGK